MRAIAYKGEGGLILVIFVRANCDDAYNSFKKQNIWKANEMKEQNKKNKNAFEINKEFVRAQDQILTLGWKKCQLYRNLTLGELMG